MADAGAAVSERPGAPGDRPARSPAPRPDSVLTLRPLTMSAHGDEFLVGDPASGAFVVLPEVAIVAIEAFRDGRTPAEAGEIARARAGEAVDTLDFAATLVELGFVTHVDGTALPAATDRMLTGGRAGAVAARAARPLFSRPAWILYGVLFAAGAAVMAVRPQYRPHASAVFFLDNPVRSVATLYPFTLVALALHEGAHWLAARVQGVPARVTISRRLYFAVLEADLSGLWGLPRRQRLSPLLAGMALDTLVIAGLLASRVAIDAGAWNASATLSDALAAMTTIMVVTLSFQFFVFLRTDVYGVLVVWLGCLNLTRVNQLTLRRYWRTLTAAESRELDAAHPRDLQVVRWYRWVYLGGLTLAGWYFAAYFAPWIVTVVEWIGTTVAGEPPSSGKFWEAVCFGALALLPATVALIVAIRGSARGAASR